MNNAQYRDDDIRTLSDIICTIVLLVIGVLLVTHNVAWGDIGTCFTALVTYLYRGFEEQAKRRRDRMIDELRDNCDNDSDIISNSR